MTASDTALSDSASSDPDSGASALDGPGPEPQAQQAGSARRADSYRRLWQPPGRRAADRQALGQPYVWSGTEEPGQAEEPDFSPVPQPAPAAPAASAADTALGNGDGGTAAAADRASVLPAGPLRGGSLLWPDRAGERDARQDSGAEFEYSPSGHSPEPHSAYVDSSHVDSSHLGSAHRYSPCLRHDSATAVAAAAAVAERAVIGNLLRLPIAWCQSGSCITWHADPAALGEADVRARALAAGWFMDVFDRLVCPDCQQRNYVWTSRPPAPWTGRVPGPGPRADSQAAIAGRHRRQY